MRESEIMVETLSTPAEIMKKAMKVHGYEGEIDSLTTEQKAECIICYLLNEGSGRINRIAKLISAEEIPDDQKKVLVEEEIKKIALILGGSSILGFIYDAPRSAVEELKIWKTIEAERGDSMLVKLIQYWIKNEPPISVTEVHMVLCNEVRMAEMLRAVKQDLAKGNKEGADETAMELMQLFVEAGSPMAPSVVLVKKD